MCLAYIFSPSLSLARYKSLVTSSRSLWSVRMRRLSSALGVDEEEELEEDEDGELL